MSGETISKGFKFNIGYDGVAVMETSYACVPLTLYSPFWSVGYQPSNFVCSYGSTGIFPQGRSRV